MQWQGALIERRPVNAWRSSSASGMNSKLCVTTPRNTALIERIRREADAFRKMFDADDQKG